MRRLRQLSMAVVLTFMLGTCSLAGTIECPPAPSSVTATGIIGTVPSGAQPVAPATDPFVDVVLDLMQNLLSLF